MAQKNVQPQAEPEYGAGVQADQSAQAIQAAQMQGAAQEAEAAQLAQPVVPEAPVVPDGQQAPAGQPAPGPQSVNVKNPWMLLPPTFNFRGQPQAMPKTPIEQQQDAGRLWNVLASDPRAPEITRIVARGLMRRKT